MNASASAEQKYTWTDLAECADHKRLEDVSAMDIYMNSLPKGMHPAGSLMGMLISECSNSTEGDASQPNGIGIARGPRDRDHCLVGFRIEATRISVCRYVAMADFSINWPYSRTDLVAYIRRQGKMPSPMQRTEIAKRRASLKHQLDQFNEQTEHLFPTFNTYDVAFEDIPYGDDVISDAEEEDPSLIPTVPRGDVEKMEVLLPSSYPGMLPLEFKMASETEIRLRIAQADEALEGIRQEICHKSYIYRTNIRMAANKKGKGRGYQALHAADRCLRRHIRIYRQARWALSRLHAPHVTLAKYAELRDIDIQPLKSVYDPTAPGQSSSSIPWIWKLDISRGTNAEYLHECESLFFSGQFRPCNIHKPQVYRINWLRARAKKMRWEEEVALIRKEMDWTVAFFLNSAETWKRLATSSSGGPRCYADKKSDMFRGLALHAETAFRTCLAKVTYLEN